MADYYDNDCPEQNFEYELDHDDDEESVLDSENEDSIEDLIVTDNNESCIILDKKTKKQKIEIPRKSYPVLRHYEKSALIIFRSGEHLAKGNPSIFTKTECLQYGLTDSNSIAKFELEFCINEIQNNNITKHFPAIVIRNITDKHYERWPLEEFKYF